MALTIRRPRALPPRAAPPAPTRQGLRASAQRFQLKDKKLVAKQAVPRREWQDEAWGYFDDVPELKYCADPATEILTRDGWKHHGDLQVGEDVLTLDITSGLSVWRPVERVNVFDVRDEPMVAIQSRDHSSLTTPEHSWPIRSNGALRWTISGRLTNSQAFITAAPAGELPREAKYEDALVELVAWFFTEGHIAQNPGQTSRRISIGQSHRVNPGNVARIRRCLTALFGPVSPTLRYGRTIDPRPRWREMPDERGMTIFHLNTTAAAVLLDIAPGRIVDLRFIQDLTAAQLELFLETAIAADGAARTLGQSDPARLEAFTLAAILAGQSVNIRPLKSGMTIAHLRYRQTFAPVVAARSSARKKRPGCTIATVPYTGQVWCPTTSTGTWCARRNGTIYFTGNTTWLQGNVMAKIRFFVAVRDPSDPEATPIPATDPDAGLPSGAAARAQAELDRLKGPLGGRSEIARALNMNLEVAGEAYLIGIGPREVAVKDDQGQEIGTDIVPEAWAVYSVSQVEQQGGEYKITERMGATVKRPLDPLLDSEPIRVFQRHPRWSLEADCAMRGVLGQCEALLLLDNSIKAVAKSQMPAGYLLIPNELSTGPDIETQPEDGEEAPVDPFLQELYDGAVEPVQDPSSAASVAPTFVRGPSDALKEFRHVSIARDGDKTVLEKIKAGIERLARGLNLPVEAVMGHQQTTFANALQVKQDTFDDHYQPRCVLICDALTVGFLQPNLIEAGMDPTVAERIVVWFDPSGMIKQVNPVDSADKGIELDLLSGEAWRRAWGWTEDDAPDPIERLVRAVMHLRTFDPGISTAILDLLGVQLDIPSELPGTGPNTGSTGTTATIERLLAQAIAAKYGDGGKRTLDRMLIDVLEHKPEVAPALRSAARALPASRRNVGYNLMLLDRDLRSRLLVAADTALTRALEKAGNRLRAKAGQTRALASAGMIHPVYVAATLGPTLVASSGFTDDDLIGADAWTGLEAQFRTWVAAAQKQALALAGKVVALSAAHRDVLAQRQAVDLEAAWSWMRDELQALAQRRLYSPDPAQPAVGEFDPSVRIPAGLIRQAVARAGGASGIQNVVPQNAALAAAQTAAGRRPGSDREGEPIYVAVNDTKPLGGIGTGELVTSTLEEGGAGIEGYEWTYGPAMRLHPFEEHEALDGEQFVNFTDDVLLAGDWVGDYYFPGDHDGCNCDIAPVVIEPDNAGPGGGEPVPSEES